MSKFLKPFQLSGVTWSWNLHWGYPLTYELNWLHHQSGHVTFFWKWFLLCKLLITNLAGDAIYCLLLPQAICNPSFNSLPYLEVRISMRDCCTYTQPLPLPTIYVKSSQIVWIWNFHHSNNLIKENFWWRHRIGQMNYVYFTAENPI